MLDKDQIKALQNSLNKNSTSVNKKTITNTLAQFLDKNDLECPVHKTKIKAEVIKNELVIHEVCCDEHKTNVINAFRREIGNLEE